MEKNRNQSGIPYWKQIIFILTAGWVVIWIYRDTFPPIYPVIKAFFGGATDSQIGKISSSYFLGYAAMQIPSGILVDKLGRRKILIPGFILFGLGALLVSSGETLMTVYLGSILAGIGCGTYYGVAYSLTTEFVPPEKRSMATAIVNSGTALGCGIGLISSNLLVGGGIISWQTMFYLPIALILVMLVVFFKFIRPEVFKGEIDPVKEVTQTKIKDFFKPQMIAAYVLYFATLYTYYLIDTWLPNFLETERGIPSNTVGTISALVFFVAIPGALIFSRLADKMPHSKIRLIILLELLAAVILFVTLNVTHPVFLVVGFISYGFFGKLAVEPIIISWLSQFAPRQNIATTYGVFNFFGMSASVLVPTVTGFISDKTGSKVYGFYLAIAIILVGTLVFYLVNRAMVKKIKIEEIEK
ncbi:MFS transporter [Enterococcus olivae]